MGLHWTVLSRCSQRDSTCQYYLPSTLPNAILTLQAAGFWGWAPRREVPVGHDLRQALKRCPLAFTVVDAFPLIGSIIKFWQTVAES